MIKKFFIFVALGLFIFGFLNLPPTNRISGYLAALFFPERVSPEKLLQKYKNNEKIKVLVIPGHDNESWGTSFKSVREADLNLEVAENLFKFFDADSHFQTFISRNQNGYTAGFQSYFRNQTSIITEFRKYFKTIFKGAVKKGLIEEKITDYHGTASEENSLKLYGINKWANDNEVDIVLHLHFNDYPGRKLNLPGIYSGFSIYIPERQLPNSRASLVLARSIFGQMEKHFSPSDLPQEKGGIIEDQELIAIGSNASLDAAALVIEYGYIYESQFTHPVTRPLLAEELAFQTHQGIKKFFEFDTFEITKFDTSLLPYRWRVPLRRSTERRDEVLRLQAALVQERVYPPASFSKSECPLTGYFGPCTEAAVIEFQGKHGIDQVGVVGPQTSRELNELYGEY